MAGNSRARLRRCFIDTSLVFRAAAEDPRTQKDPNNSGYALDLDDSYFIQWLRVLETISPVSDPESDRLHEFGRPNLFLYHQQLICDSLLRRKSGLHRRGFVNRTQLSDWHAVTSYAYGVLKSNRTQTGCKIWFGLTRTLLVLLGHSRENGIYITQDLFFATYAPF